MDDRNDTAPGTTVSEPVAATPEHGGNDAELLEELLVEEISIDGMCGVY